MRKVTLELTGPVPCKKNLWRRGNGRTYIPNAARAVLDDLILQVAVQWRMRPAMEHPRITARFYCKSERGDLDNRWTALQDVLVKAGVLKNDNLKHCHGPITFSGEVAARERVVVELEGE